MARPRSAERRSAILRAATCVVAEQGLSASTAEIAQRAGVSNGSLFVYFETKAVLLNELYLDLKRDMGATASRELPPDASTRTQFQRVWEQWVDWARNSVDKRRALAHLAVYDDLTTETRRLAGEAMATLAEVLEQARDDGPMAGEPLSFVLALVTALAESTIDAIIADPNRAASHSQAGFEAMWRVLAGAEAPAPH